MRSIKNYSFTIWQLDDRTIASYVLTILAETKPTAEEKTCVWSRYSKTP